MIWLVALLSLARAEYRAFELVIANEATGSERVVVSSLDPRQYRRYYPIKADETITYRQTWMCRGNTSGHKPTCPKPDEETGPVLPAAQ